MAQEIINIGTGANTGDGDPLRTAMSKAKNNFAELYAFEAANLLSRVKDWALSESFAITSPTYDANGYISGGNITWPDADAGTISNVVVGVHGITSIRYNRSGGKYATVAITYDGSGNVTATTVTLTGY